MRLSVISDIHGNLDAFREILQDMASLNVDQTVCLGDMIGYGPEPEQILRLVQELNISSVRGNHEMAVIKPRLQNWFNPQARASIQKTITLLTPESLDYLQRLPNWLVIHPFRFVHGKPPASPLIYLFNVSEKQLRHIFNKMSEWITFVGHTHLLKLIAFDGLNVVHLPLCSGKIHLCPQKKYIVNAGSVGQPRDGNNAAKYVIVDSEACTLEVRFVAYDAKAVYRKIIMAGLPVTHAERLL